MTDFIKLAQQYNHVSRSTARVLRTLAEWAGYDVQEVGYTRGQKAGYNLYGVRMNRKIRPTGTARETAEYLQGILRENDHVVQ